jgi:hypothetical protein
VSNTKGRQLPPKGGGGRQGSHGNPSPIDCKVMVFVVVVIFWGYPQGGSSFCKTADMSCFGAQGGGAKVGNCPKDTVCICCCSALLMLLLLCVWFCVALQSGPRSYICLIVDSHGHNHPSGSPSAQVILLFCFLCRQELPCTQCPIGIVRTSVVAAYNNVGDQFFMVSWACGVALTEDAKVASLNPCTTWMFTAASQFGVGMGLVGGGGVL